MPQHRRDERLCHHILRSAVTLTFDLQNLIKTSVVASGYSPASFVQAIHEQGAYKLGKMKFSEFSWFSRPLKQFFPCNYNVKTRCNKPPYQPFQYLSCSNAELQNIFLRSMVTGSTHASHCVTQPIYVRLVVGFRLRHRSIPSDFQKFPEYISNFPEFSRI